MRRPGLALFAALFLSTLPASLALAQICGDVNDSGTLTTSDALAVLRKSVGQSVTLICPAAGGLARTGQATCWNAAGTEIDCSGTGQDGDVRAGIPFSFTDNGDGTVTDNVTHLMWEKLSRNGSVHDVSNTYTWAEAINARIDALNNGSFAGHADWRLPNIRELSSLFTLGGAAELRIAAAFRDACTMGCTPLQCSCTANDIGYWSSTTDPGVPTAAFGVIFIGAVQATGPKSESLHVRAVRNAT